MDTSKLYEVNITFIDNGFTDIILDAKERDRLIANWQAEHRSIVWYSGYQRDYDYNAKAETFRDAKVWLRPATILTITAERLEPIEALA